MGSNREHIKNIKVFFVKCAEYILKLIYPKKCIFCGQVLEFNSEDEFCKDCELKCEYVCDYCERCGKEVNPSKELCSDCEKQVHFFDKGRSLFIYEDELKKAILDMKYHEKAYLANGFANVLYKFFISNIKWDIDLVLAVPLHKGRFRLRGYNQSELVARRFAKLVGIPYSNDILFKNKNTHSQQGLGREDRLKNMVGSFTAKKTSSPKKILLIDDVYTTGSTIDACVKALVDAGYMDIYFLTIATGRRI